MAPGPAYRLGLGGLWGKGFLQGIQGHLNFPPEKQADFIFTMIAEEFGPVGALGVLELVVVGFCTLRAFRCGYQFGRLLAVGLGTTFFLYASVNVAIATGAVPTGGVPLLLVSHGGSAMLTTMLGFGVPLLVHAYGEAEFGAARD